MPDVSVIICTYNRSASLRRTLETMQAMNVPTQLRWELIVVDNNSTDDTAAITKQFGANVRHVFEPEQGQSAARNRGIAEAAAEFILFTDDDVDVDRHWLERHWAAAQKHPQAGIVGGKVVPKWEIPPPRWLEENSRALLRGVSLHFDLGPDERELREQASTFVGANLGFRKQAFAKTGLSFRNDLGLKGSGTIRGDEQWLLQEMTARGVIGLYVPDAIVEHRNPPERMTRAYVRKWFDGEGRACVRMGEYPPGTSLFGAPRYLWRQLFTSTAKFALTRLWSRSSTWLAHDCRIASTWGAISEFREHPPTVQQSTATTA